MKKDTIATEIEVFICNYKREEGECCFDKGAKDLTDNLKKWTKYESIKEIKVYRSGCLSKCEAGIAMACFPKKEMITEIKVTDEDEIKKGLLEALAMLKK